MKFNVKTYLKKQFGRYVKDVRIKKHWLTIELYDATPYNIRMEILRAAEFNWEYPKNIICG